MPSDDVNTDDIVTAVAPSKPCNSQVPQAKGRWFRFNNISDVVPLKCFTDPSEHVATHGESVIEWEEENSLLTHDVTRASSKSLFPFNWKSVYGRFGKILQENRSTRVSTSLEKNGDEKYSERDHILDDIIGDIKGAQNIRGEARAERTNREAERVRAGKEIWARAEDRASRQTSVGTTSRQRRWQNEEK